MSGVELGTPTLLTLILDKPAEEEHRMLASTDLPDFRDYPRHEAVRGERENEGAVTSVRLWTCGSTTRNSRRYDHCRHHTIG
ncbi:hypothetical protein BHM03_00042220 [Ensete ventricosum]|nr:hypothetical protein BHM03_00042220 [Ensete ventricosum]